MHFLSRIFFNTTLLMTSVCMHYVGAMATTLYQLLKGDQSTYALQCNVDWFSNASMGTRQFTDKTIHLHGFGQHNQLK